MILLGRGCFQLKLLGCKRQKSTPAWRKEHPWGPSGLIVGTEMSPATAGAPCLPVPVPLPSLKPTSSAAS